MTRRTRLAVILVGLTLVLALLLAYCVPPPPSQEVAFNCEPGPAYKPGETLQTNPYYVLGQVILTGGSQDVERMVAALAQQGIPLELYEGCLFSGLESLPAAEQPGELPLPDRLEAGEALSPFYDRQLGRVVVPQNQDLAINLYQIGGGKTVEQAVQAVVDLDLDQPSMAVYADPNYLTGHLAGSPCSHPFGVEGSPFGVEGSPFGVEGSPFGVEGSPNGSQGVPAQAGDFWSQWAFAEIGLLPPGERTSELTGEGVQVAIFDTSPFSLPGDTGDSVENIAIINPPLSLSVHHPFALPGLVLSSAVTRTVDVKDHGLFVAGLAHAAAPQSQIHLYRVLDGRGCGDLDHLLKALLRFTSERGGKTGRAVINLSLGIQKPRRLDDAGRARARDEIAARGAAVAAAYEMAAVETAIESLQVAVEMAHQSGAVIVAAAGNDSVQGVIQLESDVPAASPFVLGVAASGPRREPACYSNLGDVVAPGAQAGLDLSEDGNPGTAPHCFPLSTACANQGAACPYGLISLTTILPEGAAGPYGYSYWVGTSFAAPLVSGVAALHYQSASQAQVYSRILGEAAPLPAPGLAPGLIQMP